MATGQPCCWRFLIAWQVRLSYKTRTDKLTKCPRFMIKTHPEKPMKTTTIFLLLTVAFANCFAQAPKSDRQQFISADGRVALMHVRVIDGSGAAPREDQTIIIADGKIQS